MNVRQIYEKYMAPKNLQEHMLRVAAASKIITDNWIGEPIDKLSIIKACAMHDIGKPVAFDIAKQADYGMTQDDITKLESLQNFIKEKFSADEHKAAVEMCKDMGMDKSVVDIVEDVDWKYISQLLDSKNTSSILAIYCDMRVGPQGILSVKERIENLGKRTTGRDIEGYQRNGKRLEERIKKQVQIDLNSIIDKDLESLFPELLALEI